MLLPELDNWEGILEICANEEAEKMVVATFFNGKKSYNETRGLVTQIVVLS